MMEGSKKRMLEEGDDEEKLKRTSLRCDVPNIKVIVGGEQQGEEEIEKKVFWHYSHILASQSRYIDALLSAPLTAATSTNNDDNINITEISFPDISPSHWEKMIHFTTNLVAARKMSTDDALELVIMYDKYNFHTGLELCDEVLSSIFYRGEEEFKNHMINNLELLDRCVHVVVLSHEKNLKYTLANGITWMHEIFWSMYTSDCVILTVDHIRQLVPVIAFHKDDESYENVEEAIKERLSDKSIDILNPMFPAYFISQIRLIVARKTTLKLVNEIKISCCARVAGSYFAENDNDDVIEGTSIYYKNGDDSESSICLKTNKVGDWIFEDDNDTLLFICNGSRCETLPPKTGWKRIDGADTEDQYQLPAVAYYSYATGGRREVEF